MAGVHAGVRGAFLKAQVTLRPLHGEACVQLPFALVCSFPLHLYVSFGLLKYPELGIRHNMEVKSLDSEIQ